VRYQRVRSCPRILLEVASECWRAPPLTATCRPRQPRLSGSRTSRPWRLCHRGQGAYGGHCPRDGRMEALTAGVAAAAVLSGCGSGDKASTTTSRSASLSTTAVTRPASGIRSRLLTTNELAGFRVVGVIVHATPIAGSQPSRSHPTNGANETAQRSMPRPAHEVLVDADAEPIALQHRFLVNCLCSSRVALGSLAHTATR
jgi:hypothetical protein